MKNKLEKNGKKLIKTSDCIFGSEKIWRVSHNIVPALCHDCGSHNMGFITSAFLLCATVFIVETFVCSMIFVQTYRSVVCSVIRFVSVSRYNMAIGRKKFVKFEKAVSFQSIDDAVQLFQINSNNLKSHNHRFHKY